MKTEPKMSKSRRTRNKGNAARQKGNQPRTQPNQARAQTTQHAKRPATPTREDAKRALDEAHTAAAEAGEAPAAAGPIDVGEATEQELREGLQAALAAKRTYDQLIAQANRRTGELDEREAQLAKDRDDLDNERRAIAATHEDVQTREAALATQQCRLDDRDEAITRREVEAEAGFAARRQELLGPITAQARARADKWAEEQQERRGELDSELEKRRATARAEEEARRQQLQTQAEVQADKEAELHKLVAELDRERRELDDWRAIVKEDQDDVARRRHEIGRHAAAEVEVRLEAANQTIERLRGQVKELDERHRATDRLDELGDAAQVNAYIAELEGDRDQLASQLRDRPPTSAWIDLEQARRELEHATRDRDDAQREMLHLRSRLDTLEAEVEGVELLRQSKDLLQSSVDVYKAQVSELKTQLDGLSMRASTTTAFPECRRLDTDGRTQRTRQGSGPGDLKEFTDELRDRMENDREVTGADGHLHYPVEMLRTFLAGLAASNLHLLEGVSGTGKTTLPHTFARAVGGHVQKVEVQAGWRDKQDLVGYYNSFERLYRETPFIQALYHALLPDRSDRLVFIVLDEMNLSHPEQYFTDFLGALEDPSNEKFISLVDRAVPGVPERMDTEVGIRIPLPPNVWFVGTANQDETTFAFAPKTYDRAHVMEVERPHPNGRESDEPRTAPSGNRYLSSDQLSAAFEAACTKHKGLATQANLYIAGLEEVFRERFEVGWGHRMELQTSRFVPVHTAAGGSLGEALDHLVATKVVKKIAGKHSLRLDDLKELEARIPGGWPDEYHPAVATLRAIAALRDKAF
jgi:hypothetical protein